MWKLTFTSISHQRNFRNDWTGFANGFVGSTPVRPCRWAARSSWSIAHFFGSALQLIWEMKWTTTEFWAHRRTQAQGFDGLLRLHSPNRRDQLQIAIVIRIYTWTVFAYHHGFFEYLMHGYNTAGCWFQRHCRLHAIRRKADLDSIFRTFPGTLSDASRQGLRVSRYVITRVVAAMAGVIQFSRLRELMVYENGKLIPFRRRTTVSDGRGHIGSS